MQIYHLTYEHNWEKLDKDKLTGLLKKSNFKSYLNEGYGRSWIFDHLLDKKSPAYTSVKNACAFEMQNAVYFALNGLVRKLSQDPNGQTCVEDYGPVFDWTNADFAKNLDLVHSSVCFLPAFPFDETRYTWILRGFSERLDRAMSVPILMTPSLNSTQWQPLLEPKDSFPRSTEIRGMALKNGELVFYGVEDVSGGGDDFIDSATLFSVDLIAGTIQRIEAEGVEVAPLETKHLVATSEEMAIYSLGSGSPPIAVLHF